MPGRVNGRWAARSSPIPAEDDLLLFTEDAAQFHYGDRSIDKDRIVAAQILINGAVIAACVSARRASGTGAQMTTEAIDDRPEGIARDRWDVVIDGCNITWSSSSAGRSGNVYRRSCSPSSTR